MLNYCANVPANSCVAVEISKLDLSDNNEAAIKSDSKAEKDSPGDWDVNENSMGEWFIRERSNIRSSGASCPPDKDGHGTYLILKDARKALSTGQREVRVDVQVQDTLSYNGIFFAWEDMDEHFRAIFRPEDGCMAIQRRIPGQFNGHFESLASTAGNSVRRNEKFEMRLLIGQGLLQLTLRDFFTREQFAQITAIMPQFNSTLVNADLGLYASGNRQNEPVRFYNFQVFDHAYERMVNSPEPIFEMCECDGCDQVTLATGSKDWCRCCQWANDARCAEVSKCKSNYFDKNQCVDSGWCNATAPRTHCGYDDYPERDFCNKIYPVDCQLSMWGVWSFCDKNCQSAGGQVPPGSIPNGKQTRQRFVNVAPLFGGKACDPITEERACNTLPCQGGSSTSTPAQTTSSTGTGTPTGTGVTSTTGSGATTSTVSTQSGVTAATTSSDNNGGTSTSTTGGGGTSIGSAGPTTTGDDVNTPATTTPLGAPVSTTVDTNTGPTSSVSSTTADPNGTPGTTTPPGAPVTTTVIDGDTTTTTTEGGVGATPTVTPSGGSPTNPDGALQEETSDEGGLSTGAIVGIVLGSICCCILLIAALLFLARRNNDDNKGKDTALEPTKAIAADKVVADEPVAVVIAEEDINSEYDEEDEQSSSSSSEAPPDRKVPMPKTVSGHNVVPESESYETSSDIDEATSSSE